MFLDDFDRTAFCRRLTIVINRFGWRCVAFVLMTTHFHFVLAVEDDVLSRGMHDLFGPYAQAFNRRHNRYGHLRAEPFKHRPLFNDRGLRRAANYVAMNPVEAGMVAQPQDWPWSSYAGTAGDAPQFPFVDDRMLLGSIHDDLAQARELWREIVEQPNVKGIVPITFAA